MSSISYVSATDILKDPFSGFKAMTSSRQICLPPRYLGNISQGIRDQLDSEINLFCTDLQSVVIGYDNIKLLSSVGNIMDDLPFLHLRVQADYILFKPTLGCLLKGTVNKMSKDHVGCLVHDRFNASIHRPRIHLNGWRGSMLRPGEEFPFQVEDIFSNNAVISLKGKLVDQNIIEEYLKSLQNNGNSPCTGTKNYSSPRKDDFLVDSEGEITLDKEHILSQKRGRTSSGSGENDKVDGNVFHLVDVISEKEVCLPKSKKRKTKDVHKEDSHDVRKNVQVKSLVQSELEPLTPVSVKKRKLNYSDPVNESVLVKKVRFDPVLLLLLKSQRRKRRKGIRFDISEISGEDTSYLVDSSYENSSGFDNVSGQSETEKKRKKKKKRKESVHEISEISGEGTSDFGDSSFLDNSVLFCEESEQSRTERKKKKKKKKKAEDDVSGDVESPATKIKPKPNLLGKESHSKKKNTHNESVSVLEGESSGQENVLTGLASGLGEILSQMQSKTKKKKNSQKDLLEVMMALQNEVTKAAGRLTTPSPAGRKKKKQKKKRKSEASSSSEEELDVSRDKASHKSRHRSKSDDSYVVESEPSTSRLSVKKMDASTSDRSLSESVSKKRKRDTTVQMVHDDDELLVRKKKKKLKKKHMSF
ncbi:LOW QUALITY PROTEIN: DNA-directed RNA polymerase I subunit RPA43-like [Haliotis rubra]|uniref:LOW QUALITY PROTEIN: DNA-directed RNA polymerase I subunit RPA43-like n=1 Tax=Haliotis rubra TaxID=36100 RepID=UPI001EE5CBA1|nr:LOW QUALITY PROTEIN: DNA-directed RNA polymerase I subunit RPA43-like [Haliotis rubra]